MKDKIKLLLLAAVASLAVVSMAGVALAADLPADHTVDVDDDTEAVAVVVEDFDEDVTVTLEDDADEEIDSTTLEASEDPVAHHYNGTGLDDTDEVTATVESVEDEEEVGEVVVRAQNIDWPFSETLSVDNETDSVEIIAENVSHDTDLTIWEDGSAVETDTLNATDDTTIYQYDELNATEIDEVTVSLDGDAAIEDASVFAVRSSSLGAGALFGAGTDWLSGQSAMFVGIGLIALIGLAAWRVD